MDNDTQQDDGISYAPAQKASWLVRHRRVLVVVAISIVAAVLVRRWGPLVLRPARIAYLQQQALRDAPRAEHWISRYDRDATLHTPAYKLVFDEPIPWGRYVEAAGMGGWPVLFLGSRISPGGHERIVLVRVAGTFSFAGNIRSSQGSYFFGMLGEAVLPGTITSLPRKPSPTRIGLGVVTAAVQTIRIFVGQADPADASHFTIMYEVGAQRGTIDGYLQDDDSVKLKVRDGPAIDSGPINVQY